MSENRVIIHSELREVAVRAAHVFRYAWLSVDHDMTLTLSATDGKVWCACYGLGMAEWRDSPEPSECVCVRLDSLIKSLPPDGVTTARIGIQRNLVRIEWEAGSNAVPVVLSLRSPARTIQERDPALKGILDTGVLSSLIGWTCTDQKSGQNPVWTADKALIRLGPGYCDMVSLGGKKLQWARFGTDNDFEFSMVISGDRLRVLDTMMEYGSPAVVSAWGDIVHIMTPQREFVFHARHEEFPDYAPLVSSYGDDKSALPAYGCMELSWHKKGDI